MDGLNRLEFLTCRNGAFLFCTVVSPSDVHTMGLLIHILHTHKTHETLLPFAHSYLGCWWTSIYMALVFRRECKQKTKVSRMENEWNDCNEINLIFFASPYLLTSSHMTLNTRLKRVSHDNGWERVCGFHSCFPKLFLYLFSSLIGMKFFFSFPFTLDIMYNRTLSYSYPSYNFKK